MILNILQDHHQDCSQEKSVRVQSLENVDVISNVRVELNKHWKSQCHHIVKGITFKI